VSAGYGRLTAGAERGDGGVVRLEGQYGLTESLALHGAAGVSWHGGAPARAVGLEAGATYAFDVLRVVPFVEGGLAFLHVSGGHRALGLQAGLGGEYLLDRHWGLALVARYAYLPLRLGGLADHPGLLTVGLRLGYTF
jgi:hypothetical protein